MHPCYSFLNKSINLYIFRSYGKQTERKIQKITKSMFHKSSMFHSIRWTFVFGSNIFRKEHLHKSAKTQNSLLYILPQDIFYNLFQYVNLLSVICSFCSFSYFFLNQFPDFWELHLCQDWVKFSCLFNGFVPWSLCSSQK